MGLIGFGLAGVTHAALVDAAPDLELVSVATSNQERIGQLRQLYPHVAVTNAADLLADDRIELVIVATPNDNHRDLAITALEAGKHVVVDKPFTVTSGEATAVIDVATRVGRKLSVFHNRRWDNDYLTVQRLVSAGALGNVHTFVSRYERWIPDVAQGWRERSAPGGGVLYDLGSHLIDQAVELFGTPQTVFADIRSQRSGAETDDYFHLLLECKRVAVVLQSGLLVKDRGPRFELHGTKGSFLKYGVDPQSAALANGLRPGGDDWGADPESDYGTLTTDETIRVPTVHGDFPAFYAQMASAIRENANVPVDASDARDVIRIIECCLQSYSEGRAVAFA